MFDFSSLTSFASRIVESIEQTVEETVQNAHSIYNEVEKTTEGKRLEKERFSNAESYPPWTIFSEEKCILQDELRLRVLKFSEDERVFLENSPNDDLFPFNMDSALKFALAALSSDPNLDPMRFKLVPKKLKDEQFWRNYFYRVSLLREQMDVEPLFFLVEKHASINFPEPEQLPISPKHVPVPVSAELADLSAFVRTSSEPGKSSDHASFDEPDADFDFVSDDLTHMSSAKSDKLESLHSLEERLKAEILEDELNADLNIDELQLHDLGLGCDSKEIDDDALERTMQAISSMK